MEAEIAILRIMFHHNAVIPEVKQRMGRKSFFYKHSFEILYKTMLKIYREKKPVDLITLIDELRNQGNSETVGGNAALEELFLKEPPTIEKDGFSLVNLEHYLRNIEEKYWLRKFIYLAKNGIAVAYEGGDLKSLRQPLIELLGVIEDIKKIGKFRFPKTKK